MKPGAATATARPLNLRRHEKHGIQEQERRLHSTPCPVLGQEVRVSCLQILSALLFSLLGLACSYSYANSCDSTESRKEMGHPDPSSIAR